MPDYDSEMKQANMTSENQINYNVNNCPRVAALEEDKINLALELHLGKGWTQVKAAAEAGITRTMITR